MYILISFLRFSKLLIHKNYIYFGLLLVLFMQFYFDIFSFTMTNTYYNEYYEHIYISNTYNC